ncbi:MAG: hypothetical protein AB7P14_04530 [Blastocatellales bacterium]
MFGRTAYYYRIRASTPKPNSKIEPEMPIWFDQIALSCCGKKGFANLPEAGKMPAMEKSHIKSGGAQLEALTENSVWRQLILSEIKFPAAPTH